jgi:hypothetical protein
MELTIVTTCGCCWSTSTCRKSAARCRHSRLCPSRWRGVGWLGCVCQVPWRGAEGEVDDASHHRVVRCGRFVLRGWRCLLAPSATATFSDCRRWFCRCHRSFLRNGGRGCPLGRRGRGRVIPVMASRPHKTVEEACFHVRSPAPSRKGFDCWVHGVADLSTTLDGKEAVCIVATVACDVADPTTEAQLALIRRPRGQLVSHENGPSVSDVRRHRTLGKSSAVLGLSNSWGVAT